MTRGRRGVVRPGEAGKSSPATRSRRLAHERDGMARERLRVRVRFIKGLKRRFTGAAIYGYSKGRLGKIYKRSA